MAPVRPEDEPGIELPAQTADQRGAYAGPYEAGAVHLVCDGSGEVRVGDVAVAVDGCGVYTAIEHERHTRGTLEILASEGVTVLGTCFTPAPA
jgi:hypothetical protein